MMALGTEANQINPTLLIVYVNVIGIVNGAAASLQNSCMHAHTLIAPKTKCSHNISIYTYQFVPFPFSHPP
jgi:hypothetical protein